MQKQAVQYAEMVGFLKGQRLAGIEINCRLSASYDAIRNEYDRLVDASLPEVKEIFSTLPDDAPKLPQFTDIKVENIPLEDTVEIRIDNEVRDIAVSWDDACDAATSIRKEVAIVCDDGTGVHIRVCKLEVFKVDGVWKSYPLSSVGGRVEWLYPTCQTRYVRIKGYLNRETDIYKWIEVLPEAGRHGIVTSSGITACRQTSHAGYGITLSYPFAAQFEQVAGRWLLSGDHSNVKWISHVQADTSHQFKVGDVVYLQSDVGQPVIAGFQIDSIYYNNLCLMASIRCLIGNTVWMSGHTTVAPVIQLVNAKHILRT